MWKRHLLLVAVGLAGLAGITGQLLIPRRITDPRDFQPRRYRQPEFQQALARVNQQFARDWKEAGLEPAGMADGLTVARRLSLGLTGSIASLEEIRALEARPAELRIAWWLDRLLEDRRYADYMAERLARAYVGTENGPFLVYRRRRFVSWLSDQLHHNRPYDQMVRSLISDDGLWTDTPAVNFLTVTSRADAGNQPDPVRLAARTARAFLGVRLDCVECHDDNLGGDWRQVDFHQLAAYYGQARFSLLGIRDRGGEYACTYLGESEPQVVPPQVPFASELAPAQGPRRRQLARWVTHPENAAFARAIVNRVWALLLGRPLVEPIDNLPLEGPFPPGLEELAEDFTTHGYDLRRLIRLIAMSDVMQLDSRAAHEVTVAHERHWCVYPLTRLRPEQVAGSLLQSAWLSTVDAHAHILVRLARSAQQDEFVRRYGDTGEDEFAAHGGTIPQRLLLMNGNLVKERTRDNLLANAATRIAVLAPDDRQAVEAAYLAVLTRRPSRAEAAQFSMRLQNSRGPARIAALEDIYWTLLNSTEFSWNH